MKMSESPQDLDSHLFLILMEAAMKAAMASNSSLLVLVETPKGRSWVGRNKLKEDFVNNRLQLEPDDNEYILNPGVQSFLRQPSVTEQEHNHQLFLQQQKHNKERLTKKLMTTTTATTAGVKRSISDDASSSSNSPSASSRPTPTTITPTTTTAPIPLEVVGVKKVKYHERKKSRDTVGRIKDSDKIAASATAAACTAGFSGFGLDDSTAGRKESTLPQSGGGGPPPKQRKSADEATTITTTTSTLSIVKVVGNVHHQTEMTGSGGEHEGTRRKIKIPPNLEVFVKKEVEDEEHVDSAAYDDDVDDDNDDDREEGDYEERQRRASSATPPPALTSDSPPPPRIPPPTSPSSSSSDPPTLPPPSISSSSTSDLVLSLDAQVSSPTRERFEAAKKSLDLSEIFDQSTTTYRTVSSLVYEYASHWARQCPVPGHKGKEVNAFFADKFDAWFDELDEGGDNRQVRSFLRAMTMKSFGSQRNRVVKKLGGGGGAGDSLVSD